MDEYSIELGKIPTSKLNEIIYAVNCKVSKEKLALRSAKESRFFDNLVDEAVAHEEKYGFWPTFEMGEIEYDDPRLDIYGD